MGCPTALVTAVAAVIFSPGALLTPAPKIALFGRIPRAGGVNSHHVHDRLSAGAIFGYWEAWAPRKTIHCLKTHLGRSGPWLGAYPPGCPL